MSSAGKDTNKHAFFWPLTETDVRFCETLMSRYITYLGDYVELLNLHPNAAFFAPDDMFGKTFTDWAPFHANNLGIMLTDNTSYRDTDALLAAVTDYLSKQKDGEGALDITTNSLASANFCVVESVQQMVSVARRRRQWMLQQTGLLTWDEPVTDWENPAYDQYAAEIEGYLRSWYGCINLSEESIAALSERDKAILQGCQGFMPYADPASGFEQKYEKRFGTKPTFAECKLYDALLLTGEAARSYEKTVGEEAKQDFTENQLFNACICLVAFETSDGKPRLTGTSSPIAFHAETFAQIGHTTYLHWQIRDGKLVFLTYIAPDGDTKVGTDASWNIILILDASLPNELGVVRSEYIGPDLFGGSDNLPRAVVDYDNASLTAADIAEILQGKIPSTPNAVGGWGADNVLFYWSGHGRKGEFVWRDGKAGSGFTAELLRSIAEQMMEGDGSANKCRKLLVIAEPCYSESVIQPLEGLTGVLAMSSASGEEKSLAENWHPDLGPYGTWMADRFTRNVVRFLADHSGGGNLQSPTYHDLYIYCVRNTLGSHPKIVNAFNFGNLYADSPLEFFRYNKQ